MSDDWIDRLISEAAAAVANELEREAELGRPRWAEGGQRAFASGDRLTLVSPGKITEHRIVGVDLLANLT